MKKLPNNPNCALCIVHCAFSILFFLLSFLFLWRGIPQYLLYQEQYQLFLFTGDYFIERISVPGGFADYIAEFIVQFYYVPLYGAMLTALVLTLAQVFLGLACRRCSLPGIAYALSAIPSILCLAAFSDENTILSLPVALLIVAFSLLWVGTRRGASPASNPRQTPRRHSSSGARAAARPYSADLIILILPFFILYWLAGPFAFVYIVAAGILRRAPIAAIISLIVGIAFVWLLQRLCLQQYPLSRLLLGINYYRIPEIYPTRFFIIAAITSLITLITLIKSPKLSDRSEKYDLSKSLIAMTALLIAAAFYVPSCFNAEKSRMMKYESLVRQGRWSDIIANAKVDRPQDFFSLQALNLALGMTGQLTESMFEFDQKGPAGLIDRNQLDNTSPLVISEALYRLGLTNIAFSTTFDLQESIMNDRKSGRFMKRLAECMIINGNYAVAKKYIAILRNSLFYADWAKKATSLLENDAAVEAHPIYGPLRRNGFKRNAFYDYSQIDKILAMLAVDNGNSNPLVWQYFCAAAMLKADLPTLVGIFNSLDDQEGHQSGTLPKHLQEAMAMYWTLSHPSFDGIPYDISPDIRRQTAALAQAVMQYPDNPTAWQSAAPASFSLYFLNLQRRPSSQPSSPSPHHFTHE